MTIERIGALALMGLFISAVAPVMTGLASHADAAVTGYTDNAAGLVSNVTVDGTTHNTSDLINGTLTGFADPNAVQLLVGEGGSVPASGSRAGVVSDLSLSTGLLNISGSFTFTFDTAVANEAGTDLLIWDWGAFNNDTFDITLNGQTLSLGDQDSSTSGYNVTIPPGGSYLQGPGRDSDWFGSDSSSGVSTVAEMEALAFTGSKNDTTASNHGVIGLDLNAFGVASGGSITDLTISGGSGTVDPTLILGIHEAVGVPEPASVAMGLAGLTLVACRRRR